MYAWGADTVEVEEVSRHRAFGYNQQFQGLGIRLRMRRAGGPLGMTNIHTSPKHATRRVLA